MALRAAFLASWSADADPDEAEAAGEDVKYQMHFHYYEYLHQMVEERNLDGLGAALKKK